MNSKDVRRMLESIAFSAQNAADEAMAKMQTAGQSLSEKYDAAKLNVWLARVRGEQERVFADMGRTLFLVNTGNYAQGEEDHPTAQQVMDQLLVSAEQKQQEIDHITARLAELTDELRCPLCGEKYSEGARFCSGCGAKLPHAHGEE